MTQKLSFQKIKTLAIAFAVAVACIVLPSVETIAAPLATPTGLKQTAATSTGIQFSWNGVAGATAYGCSISKDGKDWTPEVTVTSNLHVFTGLVPAKSYVVRVRAYNGAWGNYSELFAVSTSPKACTKLKETAATTNAIAVEWDAVEGVSGYNVWLGVGNGATKLVKTTAAKTTSLIMKGLASDTKFTVEVVPFIKTKSGFQACAEPKRLKSAVTTSGPVKNVRLVSFDTVTGNIAISWKNSAKNETGYEIQLLNAKDKKVKSFFVKGSKATIGSSVTKKLASKAGKVRVRTYVTCDSKKFYGEWSKAMILVPNAAATATQVSATSVKVSWKPVEGAKSYSVYYSTNPNGSYKKLTTVGKTVNSYSFNNLKATSKYYVFVRANDVKVGKKRYSSTKTKVKTPVTVALKAATTK